MSYFSTILLLLLALAPLPSHGGAYPYACADGTAALSNRIPRFGTLFMADQAAQMDPKFAYAIVGEGLHEVSISRLIKLHPLPNPKREPPLPANHITAIKASIAGNGFRLDESAPPKAFLMPNGDLIIASGHHRVEAMRQLNEATVPMVILRWDRVQPAVREVYLQEYGDAIRASLNRPF